MQKTLVGKNKSYTFDFVTANETENPTEDFGLLFHGKCDQTHEPVIIRHIANKQLIKSQQHLLLVQNIFATLNQLHSGIVQTRDFIYDENGIFIVREQLEGIDLHQIAFTGDYPHLRSQKFFLKVAEKVCEILSVLHQNKIIHRRIQPSNIFLVANEFGQIDKENPTVKLLNIEYAQINGQNILGFSSIPYVLYYSAPELVLQCNPMVNATCDLYSLGISIYEAFAREHAFICDDDDKNLILNMQLSYPIKRHHRIPKQVFPLLQQATAKHLFKSPPMRYKPDARTKYFYLAQKNRFQSAEEMQQALATLITELPDEKENVIIQKLKKILKTK